MAILAVLRNFYDKVTPLPHKLDPTNQSTNPPTASATNAKSTGDNEDEPNTASCPREIMLPSIGSPLQQLPRAPPNAPRKKNWRRSIRDFIVGENGTLFFIHEIVPSTPRLDCLAHPTSPRTPGLPPIYAAEMRLHSQPSASQDVGSASTRPAGASPANPGHQVLDVLDQLSGVQNAPPTAEGRLARATHLKPDDSRDLIQTERYVAGTPSHTIRSISALHHCAHVDPDSRNAGRFARHSSNASSSSSLATSHSSMRALPSSTSTTPSSAASVVPEEEMHDEARVYGSARIDVYDRLWSDARRRERETSMCHPLADS
ncbi:hypothetical protein CERZMDRAFT_99468 [Cercospora zeae-maydis SCOH1-5]|uniref:Uncharacterized protein n=1 Tax=Cercospora zeae-maydis SCOH1-5 TaxID=717836 RepID=A0A6A6FAK8_9PEZI|nr:hypothetical protein CERZMDRAFT_99468 [Cercospora zeae-maydis SCOH1-5]